jgi:Na+-transporting NADH:ubiquinone oxidoreductase subunit C
MNKDSVLYTVLFSLGVTFLLVLPLSVANELTKDKVKENQQVASALSILQAMAIPADKNDAKSVIATFDALDKFRLEGDKLVTVTTSEVREAERLKRPYDPLYFRSKSGDLATWAGAFTGQGLWGNLVLAVGFDGLISKFTGVQVIAHVETPGLGARVAEPWFLNQFLGQQVPSSGALAFVNGSGAGDSDKENDTVDGVTGATITTKGFVATVNSAVAQMKQLTGGVQ